MRQRPYKGLGGNIYTTQIDKKYSFFTYNDQTIHYQYIGPKNGEIIILVPGATLPLAVWEPIIEPLLLSQFRILRYDVPGRGYSNASKKYDLPTLVDDLHKLITHLEINKPFHLVGLALGALVATSFSIKYSSQIASILLIAPDGLNTHFSLAESILKTSFIGDILFPLMARKILFKRIPRYSSRDSVQEFIQHLLYFSSQRPDFYRAVLKTVRQMPIHEGEDYYKKLAETYFPKKVLWGEFDQITPVASADSFRKIFGIESVEIIPNVGHLPFVEEPQKVKDSIETFIKKSFEHKKDSP